MSYILKKILSKLIFIKNYYAGKATIFMLHRVYPFEADKLSPNENMKVSPEFLEKFILNLKSEGYNFISLDRLYEILQNGEKVEKQIVFTLDDGYKDNFTHAYPIFKKYNIPFTVYITTSFPEKKALLWWYILEDLIIENSQLNLSNNLTFQCTNMNEKINTFMKVRDIILSFGNKDFIEKFDALFENYKIDCFQAGRNLSMDWDEVIALSSDELVTIGGHTLHHYALNQLSKDEVLKEILEANQMIESKIGKKVEHFAYPFGSQNEVNQREFDIVKDLGFKTTTTTRNGTIYKEHQNLLECLPRIMLTENFDVGDIGIIRKKRIVSI